MKLEKELELYQIAEDQAGYFSLHQPSVRRLKIVCILRTHLRNFLACEK
ncbi:MAG: hypothetical protein H8D34_22915 [Chloroflexi bacterium]|nr:hypothetical protein [Chloroflexota bacterium]